MAVSSKKTQVTTLFTIESASAFEGKLNLTYSLNGKSTEVGERIINLKKGMNKVKIDLAFNNPALWWPNGLGDHPIYDFGVTRLIL